MYMNRGCGLMVRIRPCQGCDGGSIPLVRSNYVFKSLIYNDFSFFTLLFTPTLFLFYMNEENQT